MKFSIADYKTVITNCENKEDINSVLSLFNEDIDLYSSFEKTILYKLVDEKLQTFK